MRNHLLVLTLSTAILASAPAAAELYKWVDERGVTNYSNEPPADSKAAKKLARIENRLSVYTPDESFMQAVKALRDKRNRTLLEPEPTGPQFARIQSPSPYEQCLASGRPGCEMVYDGYPPAYLPGAVLLPTRPLHATRFLTPPPNRASIANKSRALPQARAGHGMQWR